MRRFGVSVVGGGSLRLARFTFVGDEGCCNFDDFAGFAVERLDRAGAGTVDFDDCFCRLHLGNHFRFFYFLAFLNAPLEQLRFFQTFAQVREQKGV